MAITHATSAPGTPPPAGLIVGGNEWNAAHVGGVDISALAGDLLPSVDDTYSLGSDSKRWKEGHFSQSLAIGASPASVGPIRLANNARIYARNFADDGDYQLPYLGVDDYLHFDENLQLDDNVRLTFGTSAATSGSVRTPSSWHWYQNSQAGGTNYEVLGMYGNVLVLGDWGHFKLNQQTGQVLFGGNDLSPDTNDSYSLGVVGKTWGDIYATLPTSDPGNNGMWVNAANHNAVTIGDGS